MLESNDVITEEDTAPQPTARGEGQIRPRARLLRTIGAELISSEQVAIIELVRNCYDADASSVEVRFTDPHLPEKASLEIWDNGHGMSREILLGPWLEPATDHKASSGTGGNAGVRSPGGRRRLGSKGVGRFAAQRLGKALKLFTRTPASVVELVADFDWSRLDRADRYLDELRIPWWEQSPAHLKQHGTALVISELADHWTPDRFEKLRLALSRLVSPTMQRSGFSIHLVINSSREEIKPALGTKQAMYTLEGTVEVGGRCKMVYTDLSGKKERWQRRVIWPDEGETAGPFSFRLNAWDLDREPLLLFLKRIDSPLGLRDFKRVVRDHSGISLYRDGFRILPYGEPDNDWLRLDRRRVNNPTMRLSNNQILGWLQLSADANPLLKDQTNREGLVDNGAYGHLQQVVLDLLGLLEARRFKARRSLGINWTRKSHVLPGLTDRDKEVEQVLGKLEKGSGGAKGKKNVAELRTLITEQKQETVETIQHYASLASVGQMSGLVFEQLSHPLRQAKSELKTSLAEVKAGGLDEEDLEDLAARMERAVLLIGEMELRMRRMDPLAVGKRAQKPVRQKLSAFVEPVLSAFSGRMDEAGITVALKAAQDVEVEVPPLVVQQVLANLLDNSLFWLGEKDGARLLTVYLNKAGFVVTNNGPKIPKANLEQVFEPHFSTRPEASGMGLTLCRDLLLSVGGRIEGTNATEGVMWTVVI